MEQQSGIQGITLTEPQSLEDLATLNSVMRLMAPERGAEQPLNKYARYRDWETNMKSIVKVEIRRGGKTIPAGNISVDNRCNPVGTASTARKKAERLFHDTRPASIDTSLQKAFK